MGVHEVMEIVQDIYQKERWVNKPLGNTKPADELSNEKNMGGFVGDPERDYNKPIQTINFTHFREDGWKTILSFWGLRPIFSCELLVSGRSPLWSGPLVAAGCSTNDMGGEESPSHRIHGTGIFCLHLVDFCGIHVLEYIQWEYNKFFFWRCSWNLTRVENHQVQVSAVVCDVHLDHEYILQASYR